MNNKSLCFLIPFFSNLGCILAPQIDQKSKKIIQKSTSKPHLNSDSFSALVFTVFSSIFDTIQHEKYSQSDGVVFVCRLSFFFTSACLSN